MLENAKAMNKKKLASDIRGSLACGALNRCTRAMQYQSRRGKAYPAQQACKRYRRDSTCNTPYRADCHCLCVLSVQKTLHIM